MRVYLDASVLVALFTDDPLSGKADAILRSNTAIPIVSDFAAAEMASAVSRKVRTTELSIEEARDALRDLDTWVALGAERVEICPADVAAADAFIRRLDLSLRTPDAIHIAAALRLRVTLATLDRRMAAEAATLGIAAPQL